VAQGDLIEMHQIRILPGDRATVELTPYV